VSVLFELPIEPYLNLLKKMKIDCTEFQHRIPDDGI